jgi:hypothetical protein
MPAPAKTEPGIARGQRVIREVVFEPDPEMVARVRHVRRPGAPLPPQLQTDGKTVAVADDAVDVAEPVETPSVWEALEEDED